MNNICTSVEQSQKLIELGIDVNTADMYYFTIIRNYPYSQGKIKTIAKIMDGSFSSNYDIPAWSLAALFELMPGVNFYKSGNKIKIENAYRTIRNDISLIDAAFEMICWLKENNKI